MLRCFCAVDPDHVFLAIYLYDIKNKQKSKHKKTLWLKVKHLTITPKCPSSPNCYHKIKSTQLSGMSLCAEAIQFPFTGTRRGPNLLFQHNDAPVHKAAL